MKIECTTMFDCSATGVTGHFRISHVPFQDKNGHTIETQNQWNRSRNQQRNWETIMQILQLRSQIEILQEPSHVNGKWSFVFEIERDETYGENFQSLMEDAAGVPMLTGLDEKQGLKPMLIVRGQHQNIWFISINK